MTLTHAPQEGVLMRAEVHNHGFVELLEYMGDDLTIVNNAKVSFDQSISRELFESGDEATLKMIRGLLNFLARERHGSPWEAPEFRFRVKGPIFVYREWHRHRMAELNEESLRYSVRELPEHYVPLPEHVREQTGKPGSYSFRPIEDPGIVADTREIIDDISTQAFLAYRKMLDMGVAKEVARTVLPVGTYSTMIWKANLRSLLNFFMLRSTNPELENGGHAQYEIRAYSDVMEAMIRAVLPMAMEAFDTNGRIAP